MDENVINLARAVELIAKPPHLTQVNNLVVEFDPATPIHGPLLKALAKSGQAFNFATLTGARPIVARDDRYIANSLCFTINGPGFVTEEIGDKMWMLDDMTRYRITGYDEEHGGLYQLGVSDDPFADYDKFTFEQGVVKPGPALEYKLTREHVPGLIRILGEFLTELTATAVAHKVPPNEMGPHFVVETLCDAIGCDLEDFEAILNAYQAAAQTPEQQAFEAVLVRMLVQSIEDRA